MFLQIGEKTLCNLVQSDRFWNDVKVIVKMFQPCLYILRLADRQTPAMDQLYFYVRKMDTLISYVKKSLNELDDQYSKQEGPNIETKIMNYFLRSKDNVDLKAVLETSNIDDDDDDDSVYDEQSDDEVSDDEMESDDESASEIDDNRCGSIVEKAWIRRSKALRTDVAISGWFCSPYQEIIYDCSLNHTGEHKTAVTRLLRKWFCNKVSTKYKLFFSKLFLTPLFFLVSEG